MKRLILPAILLATLLLAPALARASIDEPNDPYYEDQWALKQVGASCAWRYTTGSPDVTVAVVDSGVDLGHPDLVDRLRDDGRDFVSNDDDPSDENGHGTNVAGIIAETLDNNEGGVGLAPGVRILPVRVMNARGSGSDRAIARGIRYAADKGAQVINLSLGATLMVGADTESELVSSAIRYAQDKGSLVVVAAGNDFVPLPNAIVGDNPDVLIVAATDEDDVKANFSNSGPWISVTAPGVHILSAMPTYDVYLTSEVPRDERFEKNYDYMSGTSQATPFVSALAALLFSAHPDWDAGQVAQAIKEHAADISEQNRRLAEQGYLGSGRIDACQALAGDTASITPVAGSGNGGEGEPVQPAATPEPSEPAATPNAEEPAQPLPPIVAPAQPAVPAARRIGADILIILGVLGCGGVFLLGLMVFALVRATRRQVPPPAAAVPVYAPPPVATPGAPAQWSSAPTPQWPAAAPAPPRPQAPIASSAWGALTVIAGPAQARSYTLGGAESLIGRGDECAVILIGDGTVSRRHALIRNDGRQVTVEDAGSSHGTYLGGLRVSSPVPMRQGDVLQIGQTLLRFE
jgi:thermitase